jgi:acetyltransferase
MSFRDFFEAESVAVVGASRDPEKVGHELIAALLRGGFEGKVFPVNPKADEVEGLRCYADLKSIGEVPDLVLIAVPAKAVPGVMRECASVKIKCVVIITAGFREIGDQGQELERDVLQIARRADMRVLGPNCLGLMAPGRKLNASFAGDLPAPGGIGYFSQSGSLLSAILDMANTNGIGFSKLVSIGNKADVGELEVMKALGEDPETRVIAGYLEDIADGEAFLREAERISHEKPILLMKSGETGAGAEAASSHTGTLARQAAVEVVFERAGVIRCESIKAQFDFARALAGQPLPEGDGVAVIANGGGPSIMAADAIEREGLTLAELAPGTVGALSEALPDAATAKNPVDLLGDALTDRYEHALRAVLDCPAVHVALVLLTPHAVTPAEAVAEAVVRAAGDRPDKPVLACFLGGAKVQAAIDLLRRGGVPAYDSPESAVAAAHVMARYARWRSRPKRVVKLFPVNRRKVEQVVERNLRRGITEIGEMEAKDILEAYGFVTPNSAVATTAEQAVNLAGQIGYPVVLKIWSPDILHKSEVGGVKSGLSSAQEVMDAFDLMMYRIPKKRPEADILGVLVEEMVTDKREVIVGMTRDPRFGPLMMFGMGGVMVEVLKDVAFYLAPLTAEEAKEMLVGTRTYRLLQGGPDERPVDIDAIAEGLQRLSQLVTEFPQIDEMDINPYMVGPEGTTPIAVDARITLRTST